mmetsp:Transcript_154964/g.281844  ORF Transcript_154964/g.281844 Transcript_154964/m.281844 type:complete len:88 (+) Transcript_154964:2217-2480(+)
MRIIASPCNGLEPCWDRICLLALKLKAERLAFTGWWLFASPLLCSGSIETCKCRALAMQTERQKILYIAYDIRLSDLAKHVETGDLL